MCDITVKDIEDRYLRKERDSVKVELYGSREEYLLGVYVDSLRELAMDYLNSGVENESRDLHHLNVFKDGTVIIVNDGSGEPLPYTTGDYITFNEFKSKYIS